MTLGGVLGVVLLKLLDSKIVLAVFTVAAIASFTLALFGPGPVARLAFPAVGFFASVMWPIIFSLALNSLAEHHGSFSGILVPASTTTPSCPSSWAWATGGTAGGHALLAMGTSWHRLLGRPLIRLHHQSRKKGDA
jgi:fucose permease